MTTNEFIKKVEELGYEIKKNTYFGMVCLDILNNKGDRVASVNSQQPYDIYTSAMFYLENEENQSKLFDLLVEYAKTPIEERVEQKKYLLLPKLEGLANGKCPLQRIRRNDLILLPCDYENDELFQQIFTDTDIRKMPAWVSEFIEQGYLIKEEIKDDNKN